ncbi:MAG: hypothetical protein WBV82_25030 [Myxococcaceae bacterium]
MKTKLGIKWHTWRRSRKTTQISNICVGTADVKVDLPSHTTGVAQGNKRGLKKHERGIYFWGHKSLKATATARRSTGVSPFARNSIVPGAPRLTPP